MDSLDHEIRTKALEFAVERARRTNAGTDNVVKEAKIFEEFISGKKGDGGDGK